MAEDRSLALERGSDRADEVGERGIAAAQCAERCQSGVAWAACAVSLDGSRALRRRGTRRTDEAIAAPRYRLDVARMFGVVAERRPHFADR